MLSKYLSIALHFVIKRLDRIYSYLAGDYYRQCTTTVTIFFPHIICPWFSYINLHHERKLDIVDR